MIYNIMDAGLKHSQYYKLTSSERTSAIRERGFSQCVHFTDKGGSSDADVRIFWCRKHRIFLNL